jgi:NADH:ubiquinone oxidoreductase subunit K
MFWEPILWNITTDYLSYFNNSVNFLTVFINIILGQIIMLIGFFGIIKRVTSILLVLISLELTLLGINFSIIFIGLLLNQPLCLIISLLLLIMSAVETAIGLSLVFLYHKAFNTTSLKSIAKLRY